MNCLGNVNLFKLYYYMQLFIFLQYLHIAYNEIYRSANNITTWHQRTYSSEFDAHRRNNKDLNHF